jgi:hypothetical protein
MSDEDEISEAGRKERFARWEQLGVDVIRTDLEATGGLRFVGGPPSVRKLAWEWVRMKEAGSEDKPATSPKKRAAKTELLTLKPGIWGMSIDLKELGRRSINWWRSKVKQKGISLSFVPNDRLCHWGVAKLGDQPATHVQGRWDVTNNSESDVMILKARLGKHETRFAQVSTHHPEDERNFFGKYPVRSHEMSEVSADFTFFPPIGTAPKPIISDVIFTDNFGNEHRVRTQFSYIGS